MEELNIMITGTGSYVPGRVVTNAEFSGHVFYDDRGERIPGDAAHIAKKFEEITGIAERRYIDNSQQLSDIAAIAAARAIEKSGIEPETLDLIIVAHNFGNILHGTSQVDVIPSIASRVKHGLKIANPSCVGFDVLFGCPGWVQGLIIARQFIRAGDAKKVLVVGAETLSRVLDPHDRDSMIYADGAGAAVLEAKPGRGEAGIISSAAQTWALDEAYYLFYGTSNKPGLSTGTRFLKMHGRKIYEFALKTVPAAMKECLDRAGRPITDLKKVFIHQANRKMDEAILKAFYRLYGTEASPDVMPMNIHFLGNSSVATIPTLLDSVWRENDPVHRLSKGDLIMFASVGAGMNVNALTYVL